MDILRKIEMSLLKENNEVDKNIRPLSIVSVVYKTMSNESRTMQNAIVLEINRLKIKVALINKNDSTQTMVRTFFLHSPSLKSVKIQKLPPKRYVKAKYNYLITKLI